MVKKGVDKVHN